MLLKEQRNNWTKLLDIIPAFLFFLLFFIGGFIEAIFISLENDQLLSSSYTFGWAYKELLDFSFIKSLSITIIMAFLVAFGSGMFGLLIAIFLAFKVSRWTWLHFAFQLPIGIPHLMAAYMLTEVFLQSGWYARLACKLGLIDNFEEFPIIVHDELGLGIFLTYLWKEVPFIVLLIFPFIKKLMEDWHEISISLGASVSQMVRWVVIPLIVPLWVGGMWVVFAFSLGAYEIPALLGSTSFGTVPVLAWQEYTQFGLERQKIAIAMNVVLAGISFLVGILCIYIQRRWYERGRRFW